MPKDKDKSKDKSKDTKKKSDKSVDKTKESKKDKSTISKKGDKKEEKKKSVKIEEESVVSALEQHHEDPAAAGIPPTFVIENVPKQPEQPSVVIQPEERWCLRHRQQLNYFCETCEEPVCPHCTIQGPHNTQIHRISSLLDAFNKRAGKLAYSIDNNLREKALMIGAQLHRVEYRIEEIKYVETIIERDTRVEYGGILERLNSAEGVKLSILQHDIEQLDNQLALINQVGSTFFDLIKDPTNPVPFLIQSREIYDTVQEIVSKQLQKEINVYPYDLPRELQAIRENLKSVSVNEILIQQKDEIIWKLIQEKDKPETFPETSDFEEQTNQEIQEWAKLADNYTQELQQSQLVCFFCGTPADETTVNKKCSQNRKLYSPSIIGLTVKQPKVKYYGNKRHFFAKPLDAKIIEQIKQLKQVPFPLLELQKVFKLILADEHSPDLSQELDNITDAEGYIANVKLCAFFIQKFHAVQIEDIEAILHWLDPANLGKISNKYFLKTLDEIQIKQPEIVEEQKEEQE